MQTHFLARVFTGALSLVLVAQSYAQKLEIAPANTTGVYNAGETVKWNVKVTGEGAQNVKSATYEIKKGGATVVAKGDLDVSTGSAVLENVPTEAAWYLAQIKIQGADGKTIQGLGGAVVDATKITPSLPRPADFDQFWNGKIAQLRAVPMNVQLTPEESGRENVDYWKVTFDNIDGAKIHAQMARPKSGEKLPALLILQWAGVYGLPKDWVTSRAAQGWLAINVMPHDLPLDEKPEFYKAQGEGALKNYNTQGNDNRDTSYFLKMLLGDVRVSDYIQSRADWNGRVLVATGNSQGGYQSIALAGLEPKISAVVVGVPAGSDHAGTTIGRSMAWPYWLSKSNNENRDKVIEASRYYDLTNFATTIKAPVLIGMGLIDVTSTPAGIMSTANGFKGPREIVVLPVAGHQDAGGTHKKFYDRSWPWLDALKNEKPVPIEKSF